MKMMFWVCMFLIAYSYSLGAEEITLCVRKNGDVRIAGSDFIKKTCRAHEKEIKIQNPPESNEPCNCQPQEPKVVVLWNNQEIDIDFEEQWSEWINIQGYRFAELRFKWIGAEDNPECFYALNANNDTEARDYYSGLISLPCDSTIIFALPARSYLQIESITPSYGILSAALTLSP